MIVAVLGDRAAMLCRLLEASGWTPLTFRIASGGLDELDPKDLVADAVLANATGGAVEQAELLDAAVRLRTRRLFWGPVHLLVPNPSPRPELLDDWEIHLHPLPPRDVRGLVEEIDASPPVPPARRRRIMLDSLRVLAEELAGLLGRMAPDSMPTPEQLKAGMKRVLEASISVPDAESFAPLCKALERALGLPDLPALDRAALQDAVASAEEQVRGRRMPGEEKSGLGVLFAALHQLNNELRLLDAPPQESIAAAAARIQPVALRLAVSAEDEFHGLQPICGAIGKILDAVISGAPSGQERGPLLEQLSKLVEWLGEHHPVVRTLQANSLIERIVVVEDHPGWRETIHSLLLSLSLPLPIALAGDVEAAQKELKQGGPALALIDLGLPRGPGQAVTEPDAGLTLIREFTGTGQGKHLRHRFVILTAATNYTDAVRKAMELGLSPTSYLHKSLEVCRAELPAQVWLALQQPSLVLPRIEVVVPTGRTARVDGCEIQLDRPVWCLLAAFAGGYWTEPGKIAPRRWQTRATLAETLAMSSVDPLTHDNADAVEGRNGRRPEPGEEEAPAGVSQPLERRIFDYVSELRGHLDRAYRQVHHQAAALDFIESVEDRYRLNANLVLLGEVSLRQPAGKPPVVLVVEDNERWRRSIVDGLEVRGLTTRSAEYLEKAKQSVLAEPPDLVSLDLELPASEAEWNRGESNAACALEFLEFLRVHAPDTPVAVLTGIGSRDSIMPRILQGGVRVDDYIYKGSPDPVTRLANSLWRLWLEVTTRIRILDWDRDAPVHALHMDPVTGILAAVGSPSDPKPIKASGEGKAILKRLSECPNIMVPRDELFDLAYPDTEDWPEDVDNAFDQHIARLRRAIHKQTGIPGNQIVCGGPSGVYWLRGNVR